MKLKDKVALITGGSRGIGAAAAKLFSQEGAYVLFTYHSNIDMATKTLSELNGNGKMVQADLGKEIDIRHVFDVLKNDYNRLDVLVNNVGICKSQDFGTLPLSDWNNTIFTNLTSMFLSCQLAIPFMNDGGNIVNISSLRGLEGYGRPPIIDYSTSKAGVISFSKTLAKQLAPKIRVNCVSPGMTDTNITTAYTQEQLNQFIKSIYLGRLIEPIEVAKAILFLASDDASAITGLNLTVDGGQSLSS